MNLGTKIHCNKCEKHWIFRYILHVLNVKMFIGCQQF